MNNKTLIYKPTISYQNTGKRTTSKSKSLSLKDWIKEVLMNFVIVLMGIVFFVLTTAIAYNTYLLVKVRAEKLSLLKENKALKAKYQLLTSREIILKKAKALGLHPPQKKDILRIK